MSTVKGTNGAVLAGTRRRYDPARGWTTALRYEFSDSTSANSFGAASAGSGSVVDIDDRGPVYAVEVSAPSIDPQDPNAGDALDRYELFPVDLEKSLLEHPSFQALTEAEQLLLVDWFESGDKTSAPAVTSADGIDIYTLLRKGTDHYTSPTLGFRFTQTVPDGWNAVGGAGNSINRIFTSATLISSVGPPTLYSTLIASATASLPSPATDYARGWLKKQSTITQRGTNRSDITQEWLLENWSTFIYGAAI